MNEFNQEHLTKKQRQIADVVKKRDTSVLYMTEQEIAEEAKVSIASVSRFWMMLGYENFRDYKRVIRNKIDHSPENKMLNTVEQLNSSDLFDQLIEQHFKNLVLTSQHFDQEDFQHAVQSILEAEQVMIFAPSSSTGLGDLLEHRLKRFGVKVDRIANSGFEIYESMMHVTKDTTILIIQFVDLLPESKVIFDYAKEVGATTILLTDQLVTSMIELADCTLYAHRGEVWEFHTMVAPVAIIEALIMGVGKEMGEDSMEKLRLLSHIRKKYRSTVPK